MGGRPVQPGDKVSGSRRLSAVVGLSPTSRRRSDRSPSGFSIPAPTVTDVVTQLLEDGTVEHAYLGVLPVPLTDELIALLDIEATQGALVIEVADGSPAANAGIRPYDFVVAVGDVTVETVEDLLVVLRRHLPGQRVQLQLVRGGPEHTITLELGDVPST